MDENLSWIPLGDVNYRKVPVYHNMEWSKDLDLSKYLVAISGCGGLIAIMKDESIGGSYSTSLRPLLCIYSAAGKEISSFRWNSGQVIGLEWTHMEDLMCIQDDGQVLLYSMFCEFKKNFAMGNECRDSKVLEYRTFPSEKGTGLVVLNGLYRFYLVKDVYETRLLKLADIPGLRTAPSSWCTIGLEPKVLAASENEIYLLRYGKECTQMHPTDLKAQVSSFIEMSASLNGRHLVLYTDTGVMWMGSSDLQTKYCEFNTGIGSRPKQLLWCCNHSFKQFVSADSDEKLSSAVIVYWPKSVILVGLKKDWYRFDVLEPADGMASNHFQLDIDGIHWVSGQTHEYLQRVPWETEEIFKKGSLSPGSLLRDAMKEFGKKSEKADEYLRILIEKKELGSAITQCFRAAEEEFDSDSQKVLLRAASFGKAFHPHQEVTGEFVEVCKTVRFLNNIREDKTGILLTAKQLEYLKADTVIDRLMARRQFAMAYHICQYLQVTEDKGSSRVLAHWACFKVEQPDMDDEATARAIKNKLQNAKGVSYASIAEKAIDCNRKQLAVKLLEYELRASEQVRLLIKLGKLSLALEKAVASGNTDLTQEVIGHVRERSSLSEFFMTIRQHPVAYRLLIRSCQEQNVEMLKSLHEQEDNFLELAHCSIRESFGTQNPEDRIDSLEKSQTFFQKHKEEFCAKASQEQLRLVRQQTLFEEKSEQKFLDTSLHDTLDNLLLSGDVKNAEFLRKEFKVSDKRWWNLRIMTLARLGHFQDLESFSKSKKSPVGYIPFVEACARFGAFNEIPKYINKVPQDQRVLALIKGGNIRSAGEMALQTRNIADLDMVLKRCRADHKDIAAKVVAMLNQLQK